MYVEFNAEEASDGFPKTSKKNYNYMYLLKFNISIFYSS